MNEIRIQEIIKTEDSIQARIFINENEEILIKKSPMIRSQIE